MEDQWMSISGTPLSLGLQDFRGACASIRDYERLNQLGEGTYGVVFRAKEHRSSKIVALKQVRIPPEDRQNGVPITALREISILRCLKHDNIVNVLDVAVGSPMDEVYMVMEYCEQVSRPAPDEIIFEVASEHGRTWLAYLSSVVGEVPVASWFRTWQRCWMSCGSNSP
ncbi:hypothetical protein XANCAGTX0491_006602 [Xanthoria calcicola]